MSESVEITVISDRGFHAYGTPMETDYGHTVTVRESSSAEGPHVWLFADGSVKVAPESHDPHYDNSLGGNHVYREGHVGIHLDREQAVGLIARLQAWVDEIPQRWETSEDDGPVPDWTPQEPYREGQAVKLPDGTEVTLGAAVTASDAEWTVSGGLAPATWDPDWWRSLNPPDSRSLAAEVTRLGRELADSLRRIEALEARDRGDR